MSSLLPIIDTPEAYELSPRDEETYLRAIESIVLRHGLPSDSLRKYPIGSTIVFAVGDTHVVKLFEPIFVEAARTEHAVLTHLQERLSIQTPSVHAFGEIEGWRYIIMGQLRGSSLVDCWEDIPPAERLSLFRSLGKATRELHSLPPLRLPGPEWSSFIFARAERCVEQQGADGLSEHWLEQIPAFLDSQDLQAAADAQQVLLHTEIMREHVLVEPGPDGWLLSGLLDFEPARLGAAEYELASAGVFLAAAEPDLLRSFLYGYGYRDADLTEQLQERILLYTLLHRYSKLRWYLERLPPRRASTLQELAREWFAFW